MRKIDNLASHTYSKIYKSAALISKKKIKTLQAIAVILFIVGSMAGFIISYSLKIQTSSKAGTEITKKAPLLPILKSRGCVADGLLSGYGGDTEKSVNMVNHSECQYLHRALETWLAPPDFELAKKIKQQIKKEDVIYGMFIAEAIKTDTEYYYPDEQRNFNFKKMCRDNSENSWGENTCKPYFASDEYQKYLNYTTRQAINFGIQSFLFGQIQLQEKNDLSEAIAPAIVSVMRNYARSKGKEIVIGAQTNDITDKNYLRNFDYIEGGVGLENDGTIEKGECSERWKKDGWCWALVWNKKYSNKAKNVLVHFDWSGRQIDDLSTFARMDKETRNQILNDMNTFFTNRNIGFLYPLMGTLDEKNGGCYGPSKKFYSASRDYSCQDEETINEILQNTAPKEESTKAETWTVAPAPETSESTTPTPPTQPVE